MSLFDRLVETSELSPLFAPRALRRALLRAGVDSEQLRPEDLAAAEGEIKRTIRMFLPDRVDEIMGRIRKLAGSS